MLLKSVDIQGFKTFPDKTSLKFEDKMVAVVGPNGSGKSNVSDAIRWVLGEQSARVLRCSKMEDVIFKGTTGRKALGFAEVTMNIDNQDRSLNFENDNLAITRRYYRSGESEYLINKATVRLKDVNELFMDTGLGRDGYSIIGQGKIDSIVAAKSEERREIFEEASGISRYRYRKEESERRLSRTEENLVRLRDIVSELESRVQPLAIQAEKAKKFIEFDKEKRGLEIGIWTENLAQFEKVLREQGEKTEITLAQYNKIEDDLESLNRNTQENYNNTAIVNSQIENSRNEATSFDEEALRAEGEISVLNNDISHNKINIERINSEIENTNSSNENIDIKIAEKEEEILLVNADIKIQSEKYIELSYEIENLRKGSDDLQSEINSLLQKNAQLSSDISLERIKYSSYITSKEEVENRSKNIISSIENSNENLVKIKQEQSDLEEFSKQIQDKIIEKNNALNGYNLITNQKKEKLIALKNEIDNLNLNASEQSRRAKLLEDLERNFEGFANSVKTVMREFERGFLKGIHGPVTKIIKTPAQYAVAIETALGAAMQNVVVDSEQDAKTAINLLKRRDSGRATFLPISTIRGNVVDTREVENIFGFVGIASKLVSCDAKYDGIKNSLLGRTVVAEDLDSAVIIAKKSSYRFRVVSLDGQVVNAGGSLTGGAKARNSGLLSRSAEIVRVRQKAEEFLKQAKEKAEQHKIRVDEFNKISALLEQIKIELTQLNEDKVRTVAELNSVKKEYETASFVFTELKNEEKSSKQRLENLEINMQNSQEIIKTLEQEIFEIEQNKALISDNHRESQTQAEKISEKMQEIKIRGFELEKNKEILESALNAFVERKTDSSNLFKRLETEKNEHEEKIDDLEKEISEFNEKFIILKAKAENSRLDVSSYSQKRTNLELQATKLREEERALLSERENAGKELARLQERMDSLQKEYDTIIKKLWEEYELTRKEASEQAIEIVDVKKANQRLTELKAKIRGLGSVNLSAIEEYAEVSERYEFLKVQVDDVEKSKSELLKMINELTVHMKEQFSVRFAEIASNFTTIFKDLFGGGTANLCFTDDSDILNSGIEIKVHPPGKIVSHIEALSGGEKALVAISIYFAIMKVNPPPFCMLDEVEAALDDVNVRRFADYLQKMNENTQFIVITHRRGTMESADMLYGVTMQDDGISKLLALKAHEIDEKLDLK